ncbi:MAG: SDR family NAD(P)-dependent oxidoreductase, partial [Pseudonocardia sp.]|nr:SDR family NAD(P)-dependent oxidoreductase [Pseudonocardia sp.]
MELNDRGALVTGGASGIGAAVVRRLAGGGARVAVVDRDAEGARGVADEVGGVALPGDVSDPEVMPALVADAERRFGRLDVVFLNAGTIARQTGIAELDMADYRRIV